MLLPIFTILATENHILSSSLLQFHHNLSPSLHSSHFHSIIHTKPHTFSSLLQFHHNLSPSLHSSHFHSIIHTKPHTFSSLLQFHHNLSAFFYSNSLPTPHYTLFPYLLLSNHPLISHYCTYCLHRYYYTSSGALTFQDTNKPHHHLKIPTAYIILFLPMKRVSDQYTFLLFIVPHALLSWVLDVI